MKPSVEIFATSLLATVLFALAHFLMRPAPVPALTGLAGGLAAYWVVRSRQHIGALFGVLVGILVGVGLHLYSHVSEDRMDEPPEGILLHLAQDGLLSWVIAASILALSILAIGWAPAADGGPDP